jgi:adenine deaminase
MFTGLIQGFAHRGAVACSAAWDTSDIITVGPTADMACAVNRLADLQGGAVLCEGGRSS